MPLPDNDDAEMQEDTFVSFKTENASSWSAPFKVNSLKKHVYAEENYIVRQGNCYSILKRHKNPAAPNCYDFLLLPPLIMKNCLPFDFDYQISSNACRTDGEFDRLEKQDNVCRHDV